MNENDLHNYDNNPWPVPLIGCKGKPGHRMSQHHHLGFDTGIEAPPDLPGFPWWSFLWPWSHLPRCKETTDGSKNKKAQRSLRISSWSRFLLRRLPGDMDGIMIIIWLLMKRTDQTWMASIMVPLKTTNTLTTKLDKLNRGVLDHNMLDKFNKAILNKT